MEQAIVKQTRVRGTWAAVSRAVLPGILVIRSYESLGSNIDYHSTVWHKITPVEVTLRQTATGQMKTRLVAAHVLLSKERAMSLIDKHHLVPASLSKKELEERNLPWNALDMYGTIYDTPDRDFYARYKGKINVLDIK